MNECFLAKKGIKPFKTMVLDLITNLPKTSRNNRHIVVAVDAFSKFVELKAISNRSSSEVADFFTEDIVCRYGAPEVVRID